MGFCGTYWGIWLLLGWFFFFLFIMTMSSVKPDSKKKKKDFLFTLHWLLSQTHSFFFPLVCLIPCLSLPFYYWTLNTDCNSCFLLCECMFSFRRQKPICAQRLCSDTRSPLQKRSVRIEIWHCFWLISVLGVEWQTSLC